VSSLNCLDQSNVFFSCLPRQERKPSHLFWRISAIKAASSVVFFFYRAFLGRHGPPVVQFSPARSQAPIAPFDRMGPLIPRRFVSVGFCIGRCWSDLADRMAIPALPEFVSRDLGPLSRFFWVLPNPPSPAPKSCPLSPDRHPPLIYLLRFRTCIFPLFSFANSRSSRRLDFFLQAPATPPVETTPYRETFLRYDRN